MKKENNRIRRSLFTWRDFAGIFFLIAGAITASFFIFFTFAGVKYTDLTAGAVITFGNVFFIALLCTMIYGVWRYINISRPVNRILKATEKIRNGIYGDEIKTIHKDPRNHNELDIIIEDLNTMSRELQKVETLKTDFIANVSHELKTPLTSIRNYATLLQDKTLTDAERAEYANSISQSAKSLSELVTNILRLNKLENQEIFPNRSSYDLSEQLVQSILLYEDRWEEKNVDLNIEIPEGVHIKADEELLSIVWNNLLSNALKFTEEGGKIAISLQQSSASVTVTVRDDGIGMEPEVQKHIFEKFYQGDTSHASRGNGLGLALVKRIIDITGGEILVNSAPGEGTEFMVKLPVEQNQNLSV